MIDFGFDKIALIGAVALIVIGPEKLPRVARTVGHLFGKAQRYVSDVKAEVNRSIELEELKKMKTEFEDAARDVKQSVEKEVNDASSAFDKEWRGATEGLDGPQPVVRDDRAAGAGLSPPEEELAAQARRDAAVVQAAPRRARQGAVRRCPGGALSAAAGALMATEDKDGDELAGTEAPFVSHLVELRDRMIRALIAVGICFGALALWPGPSGLYDLLAAPLVAHLPKGATLIATNVISPILVPLKITLMAAFMVALPYVLYQVWAFVAPGLYSHEKKMVLPLVVSSTLLFMLGVGFCYFLVIPGMSQFIQAFAPASITAAPDIEQYFGFVLTLFLVFGIAFEVPIAVIVLVRVGVVSIEQLQKSRGYFIVGAFVVAAVVTPPDVISQLSLAIPMCLLYEIGIIAARVAAKKPSPAAEAAAAADKAAADKADDRAAAD